MEDKNIFREMYFCTKMVAYFLNVTILQVDVV